MQLEYICTPEDSGKTVKQIISENFSISSRTLSKLKNSGGIILDGINVTVRKNVNSGSVLKLFLYESGSKSIEPWNCPIDIIYEDKNILAVNKPSAMPTHPCASSRTQTLANAVMYYYRGESFTFRPVTRLDADTTGIVLIAKNAVACAALSSNISVGTIKKQYIAICRNVPNPLCGVVDAPIARDSESIIKRKISESGKCAVTRYETVKILDGGRYSLVRCFPETGRTHQIRLHMSHIGCALYGDFLYGIQENNERALLHCEKLTFPSPDEKMHSLTLTAPLPSDMTEFLKEYGK